MEDPLTTDRNPMDNAHKSERKVVKKEVFFNMDHPDYVVGANFSRDG